MDNTCLDGTVTNFVVPHLRCPTIVIESDGSPRVCLCECKTCKRAWFADGRPVVRNGKVVRETDPKEKPMDKPADPPEHILQFFEYAHLPAHLQAVSKPFHALSHSICEGDNSFAALPRNPERSVALRKLLEAKDAAVRARLAK